MLQPQLMPSPRLDIPNGTDHPPNEHPSKQPQMATYENPIMASDAPATDSQAAQEPASTVNGSTTKPYPASKSTLVTSQNSSSPAPSSEPFPSATPASPLSSTSPTSANDYAIRAPVPQKHRHSSPTRYKPGPLHSATNSTGTTSGIATTATGAAPGSPSASSTPTAPRPQPPKLQHRHTLEVPWISSSPRHSRDHASPTSLASEDGAYSSSRKTRRGSLTLVRRVTRTFHPDGSGDDEMLDDDAARWANTIRSKRSARKRRKDEDDDDDRVVVGTKVDQHHVNWVTAYNMLTGIRFTVSKTNAKLRQGELTEEHFDAKHKYSFDVAGNVLMPSTKYDFKFKDYAPEVFRELRSIFHIDPANYLVSLTSKYILSELGSPGKSGGFFYFSRDYKYIIKTIHPGEHKLLRRVLRDYYNHVRANPNTLLSQFYGLHRVKIPYGKKIHFVVMNNLFPPHRDIHRIFDLKGSTVGRDFKEEELETHPRATLKDLNWLRRDLHIEFGSSRKQVFIGQIQRDVDLLKRLKIMDYSLLIGIHDLGKGNEENLRDRTLRVFEPHGEADDEPPTPLTRTESRLETERRKKELRQNLKSQKPVPMGSSLNKMPDEMPNDMARNTIFYSDDGGFRATHDDGRPADEIYYLGIIDCLTKYSLIKRSEHFLKSLTNPESQISAIPPDRYGNRFVKFISKVTVPPEQAKSSVDEKGKGRASAEAQQPDREMYTVDQQSLDGATTTLPVVEEVGETSSTGGEKSVQRTRTNESMTNHIQPEASNKEHLT